jgi:hypothetical protein
MSAEALTLFEVGAGSPGSTDVAPTSGTARTADPATSHAAAESIAPVLHIELRRVLAIITRAGAHGATAREVQGALRDAGIDRERGSVARRITDLVQVGAVRNSGAVRRLGRKGARDETVWVAR